MNEHIYTQGNCKIEVHFNAYRAAVEGKCFTACVWVPGMSYTPNNTVNARSVDFATIPEMETYIENEIVKLESVLVAERTRTELAEKAFLRFVKGHPAN